MNAMLSNSRPGVVPLRPLGVGDLLDGALRVIRRYPAATLGSAVIVAALAALVSTVAQIAVINAGRTMGPGTSATLLVSMLVSLTASALFSGVAVNPVERGLLGHAASFGDSWRRAFSRFPALLGATLLLGLVLTLGATAVNLPVILLAVLVHEMFFMLLMVSAGITPLLLLALFVPMMLTVPAVIVEELGPVRAVQRSLQLTRRAFWELFGKSLLVGLIVMVVYWVVSIPASIVGAVVLFFSVDSMDPSATGLPVAYYVALAISNILVFTLTYPYISSAMGLLYFDQRMRREGLDVELARRAAQR